MIIRIVRMSFQQDKTGDFEAIFEASRNKIVAFEGCSKVELLQDVKESNVFMTYSFWESEEHLNNYRNSELFKDTWSRTKKLFNDKPQAWSLEKRNEA